VQTIPAVSRALGFPPLVRDRLATLQVNLGYRCNQACGHCHVEAGPKRTETMSAQTVADVLAFLEREGIADLDLTGGAPELHPMFRHLVTEARRLGAAVTDRCNLTVLEEPDQGDLAGFLASQGVAIIASLPCYLEDNVDRQRGKGTFSASLRALRRLNGLGYGRPGSGLTLDLVFNPPDDSLPPPQGELEPAYKRELDSRYGIVFNRLLTLANMPIRRFANRLAAQGRYHGYLELLRRAHDPANLERVMCRSLISVDWQGQVYDCDFNQMLGLPLQTAGIDRPHISRLKTASLNGLKVRVADHCYGCTAGQGSSCGGALQRHSQRGNGEGS
jgi:radical SAM/Cys-rich protein